MKPTETPLDAAWLPLLDAIGALLDLAAIVRAAGHPRARKGQELARRSATAAMALLGLDRWEHRGVRFTLTSAPTVTVDGEVIITGPSRLIVRMAPVRRDNVIDITSRLPLRVA